MDEETVKDHLSEIFMAMKTTYQVFAYGITDIGLVRQNNEDCWAQVPELKFYVLADGMGGHRAGEVASREAVKALCEHFRQTIAIAGPNLSIDEAHGLVQLSIEHANQSVYDLSKTDPELQGMGTTICCLYCHSKGIIYAHVGDSRIYRLHNHKLEQLTKDHSLLRELVDMGQIDEYTAEDFLYKNIITKAVGTERSIDPSVHICDIKNHDIFFMCSDGLSDMLTLKEMEKIVLENPSIESAAKILVDQAKAKGGLDNITVVIIKIDELNEKSLSR